ncbi:MAG: hypothetical protein MJ050_08650, partial [Phascolarctobacterium sp.]|nr:hypothetical protein [Phascolarctobacterium sp.]
MKFLKNKAKKALMAAVTMSLVMGVCGSAMAGNTYCGQNDGTWGTAAQATTGFTGVWDDKSGVDNNGEAAGVFGVLSKSSAVSSNTVTILGGSMDYFYGAQLLEDFDASLNVVTVNGNATFRSGVCCASSGGAALYNTFNINGGNFNGVVCGAEAYRRNAEGNIVNISGGTLEPLTKKTQAVYGGYSYSGIAKGNIVNISGGT